MQTRNYVQIADTISYPICTTMQGSKVYIETVVQALKKMEDMTSHFNIICMGSSGILLAGMLAMSLDNVTVYPIRKQNEECHMRNILGRIKNRPLNSVNIIIDDFISTGKTIRLIEQALLIQGIESIDYLICMNAHLLKKTTLQIDNVISDYQPEGYVKID